MDFGADKILVSLKFENPDSFSAFTLVNALIELQRVSLEWDEDVIRLLAKEGGVDSALLEKALRHARNNRKRVVLHSARTGSVFFDFIFYGTATFILSKVVGDTVNDAIKLTRIRHYLVERLAEIIDNSVEKFGLFNPPVVNVDERILTVEVNEPTLVLSPPAGDIEQERRIPPSPAPPELPVPMSLQLIPEIVDPVLIRRIQDVLDEDSLVERTIE